MELNGPAIEAELFRLTKRAQTFTYCCSYCGKEFIITGPMQPLEVSEHVLSCEKHPMRSLEEQRDFWEEKSRALDAALWNLEETNKRLCEQVLRFKAEYDPKHKSDCDCYGCRRFKRCLMVP